MEQEQNPQQEGKSLTYDNFLEKYTLVENHIDKHSSFEGCIF